MQWLLTHKLAAIFFVSSVIFFALGSIQLLQSTNHQEPLVIEQLKAPQPSVIAYNSASPSATPLSISVDVAGAVEYPGVFTLTKESRISDAIDIAGGLSKKADREWIAKNINLAQRLNDSDKIYIPAKGEVVINLQPNPASLTTPFPQVAGITSGTPGYQPAPTKTPTQTSSSVQQNTPAPTSGKVSLNIATKQQLESLPGVGEVTAQKIIDNRPYATLEEVKEKKAVGNATYDKIVDLITL